MPLLPHFMTASQACWDERTAQLQSMVHPPDSNGLWIWQACWAGLRHALACRSLLKAVLQRKHTVKL